MKQPILTQAEYEATQLASAYALWAIGDLSWKLDDKQLEVYDLIKSIPTNQFVFEGARKLGKTWLHGILALECAIQNPGKAINWVCGAAISCRKVLLPILEEISLDAPTSCKGHFNSLTNQWILPSDGPARGAYIQLVGAETKADCERARGPSCIVNIIDEAGFLSAEILPYLIDSILSPQQRRVKRKVGSIVGMTLLVSTTPYVPTHPFIKLAEVARSQGCFVSKTIYDSGFQSRKEIDDYIQAEALKKGFTVAELLASPSFRREYLSERVVDDSVVVFPSFYRHRNNIVVAHPRPPGFDRYIYKRVAIDLGMTDKTAIVFGYVDFLNAKIIIEHELLLDKPNTATIAQQLSLAEDTLWSTESSNTSRISRVVDDPHGRVVMDLWDVHKVRADKAIKNDREASINLINVFLQQERLLIDPSCVKLQEQLATAYRNRSGNDFARTEDGHFDLAAALMYFIRDLNLTTNPYPHDFDILTGRTMELSHVRKMREAHNHANSPIPRGLRETLLSDSKFVSNLNKTRKR